MNTRSLRWFGALALALCTGVSLLPAIEPPVPQPLVRVLATDPAAAEEGTDTASFSVLRSGATNAALTVHYTLGGTAENGVDYEALPGTVTIPEGAFSAPVLIRPIDDFLAEGGESVILFLLDALNSTPPQHVTWPGVAVARITDNDRSSTNAPPAVVLVQPPDGAVFEVGDDVPLVAHAWDTDGSVAVVEFFAGTNSLGVAVPIPIVAPPLGSEVVPLEFSVDAAVFPDLEPAGLLDPIAIATHLFHLNWTNVPAGPQVLTAVATDDQGLSHRSPAVTITVLETPPRQTVEVKAADPVATEPGSNAEQVDTGKFLVFRHGPTNLPLEVFCRLGGTASNGVDYVELPTQVTIPAGERSAEVVVRPLPDELVEEAEYARLTLLAPVTVAIYPPPPGAYEVGRAASASVVIRDRNVPPPPPPLVRIVRPQEGEVVLAGADIRIAAVAHDASGSVVRVEFFEGTNSLGAVSNVIATASANVPQFQIVWTNVPPGRYVLTAEATGASGETAHSAPVAIKVLPHVEPPLVRIEAPDAEAAEVAPGAAANPAVFRVARSGSTDAALTVFYRVDGTAANGGDYEQLSGHVVIPAGAPGADIVVSVIDDQEAEGTETVELGLVSPIVLANTASPVATADLYRIAGDGAARAIIRDNETPNGNLPPKVALRSPQEGSAFVAPVDIHLIAGASDPDGSVQSVEFFDGTNSLGVVNGLPILDLPNVAGFGPIPVEQRFELVWSNAAVGEHVLLAKAKDNGGATSASEPVSIRVVAQVVLPVVSIEAIDPSASEGPLTTANGVGAAAIGLPFTYTTNVAVFAVRRSGPDETDLVVHYAMSGTAGNGADYQALSGQVTIPGGEHTARIVIQPADDSLVEDTETVIATLVPVAVPAIFPPPPGGYVVGEPHQATAVIRDNDVNAAPKVEIVHPRPNTVFATPASIEIEVVALDPDGWVPRVDFYAGNQLIGSRTMQFLLPPAPGQAQRFSLIWSNAPLGTHLLSALATDDRGAKTRADGVPITVVHQPELPRVGIEAVDGSASESAASAGALPDMARFRVFRAGSTGQSLTVHLQITGTALNGVDYASLPNHVTMPQGAAAVEIEVAPIDDQLLEGTESVIVTLALPNPAADTYVPVTQNRAVAFILDNDTPANQPPVVALLNPPDNAVFQAPVNLLLVAASTDKDGWVQTMEFFDGTNSLGRITNSPWVLDAVLTHVPGLNADVLLPNRPVDLPFMLMWSNVPVGSHVLTALATDNAGASTRSQAALVTVRGTNDVPLVSIAAVDAFAREGTNNAALFRVSRTGPLDQRLTVFFQFSGTASLGTDYSNPGDRVDFAVGTTSTNILLFPLADDLAEGIETVVVRLVPSQTAPDSYHIHHPDVATMVIVDSNRPEPVSTRLQDGSVMLHLAAPRGLPFRLEASDDLIYWEPVLDHVVGDEGIQFVDERPNVRQRRFLRVVPDYTQTGVQ